MANSQPFQPAPKALLFDLMGTCCDWLSSILPVMWSSPQTHLSALELEQLAKDWRAGFFAEIHSRFFANQEAEDIDVTHRRVLDRLLEENGVGDVWDEVARQRLVRSWHEQVGWVDAVPGLSRLREKFFITVLANGTTRLQLDIAKSSGLPFHMLFSSQLLGMTKPDPEIYLKAVELMQLRPEECIMVAAHAYDLRAAKNIGMKTVYIQRTTEDPDEDMDQVRADVDVFLDGMAGGEKTGLGLLANLLGCD